MKEIRTADLHCFCIAIKWAVHKKFPPILNDWHLAHWRRLVSVINILHVRKGIDLVATIAEYEEEDAKE